MMTEVEEFEVNLNDLPEEVLIEIFSYLSPKSIKIQTLVCSRWNGIIGSSREIMRKFQLNLSLGMTQQTKNLTREFLCLKISDLKFLEIENIQQKLMKLEKLQITNHTLDKVMFVKGLKEMPKLLDLSFESVKLTDESKVFNCDPVKIRNLENLSLKFSDVRILSTFSTESLKRFSIHNLESQGKADEILSFLMNQKNLKRLKIVGTLGREFILNEKCQNFNQKLQYFKLSKTNLKGTENQLIEFLRKSADSLEELVIKNPTGLVVDEFILTHMDKLRSLQVVAQLLSENERYYKPVKHNYHIKRLKVLGQIVNFRPFSKIKFLFDFIPDLQSIDISKLSGDHKIIRYLPLLYSGHNPDCKPSLNELRCFSVTELAKGKPTYDNLKSLYVTRIDDENVFNGFIRKNSKTLEEISIKEIDDAAFTRSVIVSAISECVRLKTLKIVCKSTAVVKMFNKIRWNHQWKFEVGLKDKNEKFKIIFNFPDDRPVFDEITRTWDDNLIRDFNNSSNYGLNAFINKFK